MVCTALSTSGFWLGLWHGLTAFICLVLDIFWDFKVFDQCSDSWLYNLGFLLGVVLSIAVGLFSLEIFIAIILVVLIVYAIYYIAGAVAWGILIGIAVLVAWAIFRYGSALLEEWVLRLKSRSRIFRQKDGSGALPPQ